MRACRKVAAHRLERARRTSLHFPLSARQQNCVSAENTISPQISLTSPCDVTNEKSVPGAVPELSLHQ